MTRTIQTSTNDGIRAQIMPNVQAIGIAHLEIVLACSNSTYTAWVMQFTSPRQALVKGPPRSNYEEALEGLLEATAELAAKAFAKAFEEFEGSLTEMVGEGFALETMMGDTPMYDGGAG